MDIADFQRLILEWGRNNRRDMPWRNTRNPYKILVSEVMLQQTQVSRVLLKYETFLREFPTAEVLADSSQATLLRVWQGLGYWNRALRLHDAARMIVNEFAGNFPRDPATLMTLPGIGPYTAGAVACFAFGSAEPFLDTNIRRVYLFFFFPGEDDVPDSRIMEIARRAVWLDDPREWATPSSTTAQSSSATGRSTVAAGTTLGRAPSRDRFAPSARRPSATCSLKRTRPCHVPTLRTFSRSDWQQGITRTPLRMSWMPLSMTVS